MTYKVESMLGQVSALKNYLEEHAEEVSDYKARELNRLIEGCWVVIDRRIKVRL